MLLCALLFPDAQAWGGDSSLSIINAVVQSSEDGPAVSPGFHFLPGDFVYGSFQIAGFGIRSENQDQVRRIGLQYSAAIVDEKGVLFTMPETGAIETELSSEDKNWSPKRRVSFTLPACLTEEKAKLRVQVKDVIGGGETTATVPFLIGGLTVMKADHVTVQDFKFFRGEDDKEALELAAYRPGDPVFARFEMTNFGLGPENAYGLTYDVAVTLPDGKLYLNQPHAAELADKSFYPVQFLPGTVQLTTSAGSAKGVYAVTITVHDLVAKQSAQLKSSFTLE